MFLYGNGIIKDVQSFHASYMFCAITIFGVDMFTKIKQVSGPHMVVKRPAQDKNTKMIRLMIS